MKRVRVAPGKFVTISTELSEKAARVFATALTRDQVRDLKASEPRRATGLMVGSAKPPALARPTNAVRRLLERSPRLPQASCAAEPVDAAAERTEPEPTATGSTSG
ncbi:hypothetical protein LXT12_26010 [Pelomonas sp. P7]|uniref:Uncharacterized protein n=1 Tax=Pelomonas caseinilytica TaxID=2906763 RepID=A0ABS8XNL4_9BURK|nr:hypothetical protein [Pelomonas sp. P7]MCE4540693.1 hypothetical protein [Pelomonas sp. P7]